MVSFPSNDPSAATATPTPDTFGSRTLGACDEASSELAVSVALSKLLGMKPQP
jgi:hypothetical protein